jgi:hypothetical protein
MIKYVGDDGYRFKNKFTLAGNIYYKIKGALLIYI